jgi:hypothetical protein
MIDRVRIETARYRQAANYPYLICKTKTTNYIGLQATIAAYLFMPTQPCTAPSDRSSITQKWCPNDVKYVFSKR